MSALGIALLIGLSSSAWIYSRVHNRTGGNNQSAITAGLFCGAVIALVVFLLLSLIP